MIKEFIEFTTNIISCINPYTKENIDKAIKQFELDGKKLFTTMDNNLECLAQGDVLENVPFYRVDENGRMGKFVTKGLVLSNTCDCSRDRDILLAPFIPIKETQKDRMALINNKAYGYLYFPDDKFNEEVVDFSLSNSFNREILLKGLKAEKIKKRVSLNSYGYYLLLCKLTIYLMRPEDEEIKQTRLKEVVNM